MEWLMILFFSAIILFWKQNNKRNDTSLQAANDDSTEGVRYLKQSYLTTRNEQKLFLTLHKILPDGYMIHCQTSLIALTKPENPKHRKPAYSKRVDFVITDNKTKILAVIELDDNNHQNQARHRRDQYVNQSLKDIHPFLRVKTQNFYEPVVIAKQLEQLGVKTILNELVAGGEVVLS